MRTKLLLIATVMLGVSTLLFRGPAYAQETIFSSIRGIVTDQSGALEPGARVELLDQTTGTSRSTVTGQDGGYSIEAIASGVYTITIEASGFKKFVHSDIDLSNSVTMRVDAHLEVGNVSEQVTVTGTTPIETEVPTISSDVGKGLMEATSGTVSSGANYRILQTYFNVVPGGNSGGYNGSGAINGMPNAGYAERTTIDGVRVAGTCCQSTPATGALNEMKIVTFDAGAEYATPTTFELITQSGGKSYHGNFWWLYQDRGLDTKDPLLTSKQIWHSNTIGGEVGGPIIKKKLFFFFDFERVRTSNSTTTNNPVSVLNLPTAQMQMGDFSQLLNPTFVNLYNAGQLVTVTNPLTGSPFPGNVIPANLISTVSQNLINTFWSVPTAPGLFANQFFNAKRPNERDKYDSRVDYDLSERNHIFGRYGWNNYVANIPTTGLRQTTTNNGVFTFITDNIGVGETYIINKNMTNEVKYGISELPKLNGVYPFLTEDIMGAAGIQGGGGLVGLPGLTINGFSGFAAAATGNTEYHTQTLADSLILVHGRHVLKFGVQWNEEDVNTTTATIPPTFSFNGSLSGNSWADFMLGLPSSVSRNLAPGPSHYIAKDYGFYTQDQIRVTRNLNVSVGLRYQIWPYSYETHSLMAIFDPKLGAVIVPNATAQSLVVPTFPTQLIPVLTAAQANYGAKNGALANTDHGDWAPRVGAAWRPFGAQDTVIRGGFGLFYYNGQTGGAAAGGAVFTGAQTLTQVLGPSGTLTPTIQFPNPFTNLTSGAIQTLDPTLQTFTAGDPNLKLPYVMDWNLTVEHDFHVTALQVSYLGSNQQRTQFSYNINEAPPSNLPFAQSRRPYPEVGDVNYFHNGGTWAANELQIIANRPMKHGLLFNAAFTWFHELTDTQGFTPGQFFNLGSFNANPSFATPRKQLILTYDWEVPVGRNRAYLSNLPRVADGILGGWTFVGITKFETGQYITPTYTGVNPAGTDVGTGIELPDIIPGMNPNFSRSVRESNSPTKPFFDLAAFECPGGSTINGLPNLLTAGCPESTPQNVGRFGDSGYNEIEGPGIIGWIWSITKEFRPLERVGLQFTANIANPFNHPNWAPPSTDLTTASTAGLISSTDQYGIDPFSLSRRRISFQLKLVF